MAGGTEVGYVREVAVPRVYGVRGEEFGGRESAASTAIIGRMKGRAVLYDRDEISGLMLDGEA